MPIYQDEDYLWIQNKQRWHKENPIERNQEKSKNASSMSQTKKSHHLRAKTINLGSFLKKEIDIGSESELSC